MMKHPGWPILWCILASLVLMWSACQSNESALPTTDIPTAADSGERTLTPLAVSNQRELSSSGEEEGEEEDNNSGDDTSSDDTSSDDTSSDDTSSDDSGPGGTGEGEARVRGLLFSLGSCSVGGALPCTLQIGDTEVEITEETRLDVEPQGLEGVGFDEFMMALVETGLPMRGRGTGSTPVVADRLRVDDELHAQGVVVGPPAGDTFELQVNGDPAAPLIRFRLLPGVSLPGDPMVRIEAAVPAALAAPLVYEVFRAQN